VTLFDRFMRSLARGLGESLIYSTSYDRTAIPLTSPPGRHREGALAARKRALAPIRGRLWKVAPTQRSVRSLGNAITHVVDHLEREMDLHRERPAIALIPRKDRVWT